MIVIAAWKNEHSGIGHYSRAKKYYHFLKKKKNIIKFIIFKNLNELYLKLKKINGRIILLDTYIFSQKIEKNLRKKFKKVIIINDYQFNIPKDFYCLDTFKFNLKNFHKKNYFGTQYLPRVFNQNLLKRKKRMSNLILIILNKRFQNFYIKINKIISNRKSFISNKKLVVNLTNKRIIKRFNYEDNWSFLKFLDQEKLLHIAKNSAIVISPGGQTMMNLVENNNFINVYQTSKNQDYYIKTLKKKNYINKINFKNFLLKQNKNSRYISNFKNNKLLEIF